MSQRSNDSLGRSGSAALKELPRTFDHASSESRWYRFWEEGGYFTADTQSRAPRFSVVIPPPNVTGSLHMGHMLNHTVHDVIVRRKRMQGFNTLWLPGTDHAGIATQNVVERQLRAEGLSRHDLGREEFVRRVWKWKEEYGGIITAQIRRIGASCDWSRERFTLDEGLSAAVREVFVRLYEDGLIYRGERLINWCPRCRTALSDLEVEHLETEGQLHRVRYAVEAGDRSWVEVATTRPETMLGDVALAFHPGDERYRNLVDARAVLPLVGRTLRFVPDEAVDPEFGTGLVKVTPAHDPVDFEIGERHGLDRIGVIDEDGRITDAGGSFRGLDRLEARKRVLSQLAEQGYLLGSETHRHKVGHCSRCSTIVEPLLSTQWFVRVAPLAAEAIRAVEDGRIRFVPPEWARTYFQWMYNIRDWCVSRQLWWGHRIPAWYCGRCGEVTVARTAPGACHCGSSDLAQDEDVLDTWFSSQLWPFSTMGWPEETDDYRCFYPTDVLITAFDIIFFWVARMIMAGLRFTGQVPFRDVYITGLIRDVDRQKMSKSKGNVIDPGEVCDEYGTDAVRFTLARLGVPGSDLVLSTDQLEAYRAFATKIWNAARFILTHVGASDSPVTSATLARLELSSADRWILSRLNGAIAGVNGALDRYALHEASHVLYQFFWHEFCDWYLEMTKLHPESSRAALTYVLETSLRLLHPFMPFLTEELWQRLPHEGTSITLAPYPEPVDAFRDLQVERDTGVVQEVIGKVRNIRSEIGLDAKSVVRLRVAVEDPDLVALLESHEPYIQRLARVGSLEIGSTLPHDGPAAPAIAAGLSLEVPLEGLIDVAAYEDRLQREIRKAGGEIDSLEKKLSNPGFVDRAPSEVVEENRQRLADYRERRTRLEAGLQRLR